MNFSFGIVTGGGDTNRILRIIDSINRENIPEFEIIVVGGESIPKTTHIPHNEAHGIPGWLCYKKNKIAKIAKYDNIVYMHDYVVLDVGWYDGFLRFGDNWNICMTKIVNSDGTRYTDWVLDPTSIGITPGRLEENACLLPYNVLDLSFYMFISGAYWVVKKHIMKEFPLDESLADTIDGRSYQRNEDVLWSRSVNQKYEFSMNTYSVVGLLKYHAPFFSPVNQETIDHIRKNKPTRPAFKTSPESKCSRGSYV